MKKLMLVVGVLVSFLGAGTCPGQGLPEKQRWIEQVDGGIVFPLSAAAAQGFNAGYGGDILIGYRFTRSFSLAADLGYYDCDQKVSGADSGEWLYVPLMAVARFNIGDGWMRPYAILGAGIAVNTYSLTPAYSGIKVSNRETDLLLAPGLGVLCIVADDMALYVQGRMDVNFTTPGAAGSPFSDNPSIFLPIKGGLSFFVL